MGISLDNRQKKVDYLLSRFGSDCYFCKNILDLRKFINTSLPPYALTVEHIIPRLFGGTNAVANLVLSCNRCNNVRDTDDFLTYVYSHREVTRTDQFVYQEALDYARYHLLGYRQTTIDDYIGGRAAR